MWPWGKKAAKKERIDVLVDIDGTIVHDNGPFRVMGNASYGLETGAIEFLVALDRIPNLRLAFYSAGNAYRNKNLVQLIAKEIKSRGHHSVQELDVFTVAEGMYGRKTLKNLRKSIDLSRTILVDDIGQFAERGEKQNLLKVYHERRFDELSEAAKVYNARVKNNLVRALGLILQAMDVSQSSKCTVVEGLHGLQWEARGKVYRHEATNAEAVYRRGLEAMKAVNPDFTLFDHDPIVPWSPAEDKELFHSDIFRDELLKN